MDDLQDLYQQVILDHYKQPRNFGSLKSPGKTAEGYNPLCGDRINLELEFDEEGRVADVAFNGAGCAIFTASASMMTDAIKGKTRAEVEELFGSFHKLLTEESTPEGIEGALGKLAIFAGVREFPVRVKCATLPWHTVHAAIEGSDDPVTTEPAPTSERKSMTETPPGGGGARFEGDPKLQEPITGALKMVYDPEIPVDIYELGLIYTVQIDDAKKVRVEMTLTSPACPAAETIPIEVRERIRALEGVEDVDVDIVWDPPWNPDCMSEEAKLALGMW